VIISRADIVQLRSAAHLNRINQGKSHCLCQHLGECGHTQAVCTIAVNL